MRRAEDETGTTAGFFIMLADVNQNRYRLVLECATPSEAWRHDTIAAVERTLGELNVEYAAKRASKRLGPLELVPVQTGTGEAYKQHCLQQGQREGQFKLIALQYQSDCEFPFVDRRTDHPSERKT